jgi:putative sigma-54 modulation protein
MRHDAGEPNFRGEVFMKSILKGVHVNLGPRLKEHVETHLVQQIASFYNDEAAEIEIHLRDNNGPKRGNDRECSVTFRMPGSSSIHVTEISDDMYKSIDLARDRLERLIKRELQKKREPTGHPISNPASRPVSAAYEGTDVEDIGR